MKKIYEYKLRKILSILKKNFFLDRKAKIFLADIYAQDTKKRKKNQAKIRK